MGVGGLCSPWRLWPGPPPTLVPGVGWGSPGARGPEPFAWPPPPPPPSGSVWLPLGDEAESLLAWSVCSWVSGPAWNPGGHSDGGAALLMASLGASPQLSGVMNILTMFPEMFFLAHCSASHPPPQTPPTRCCVSHRASHLLAVHIAWLWHCIPSMGFPGGSDSKESTCNAGDLGSIPGLGRSPGGGHGNPLQHSCLENPTDRGAWQAALQGVTESDTTE